MSYLRRDLASARAHIAGTVWAVLLAAPAVAQAVPLRVWTSPSAPGGQRFGHVYGVAVGDYDADGWPDVYCNHPGQLWRNLQGQGWQATINLNAGVVGSLRYSASFADLDADGRADIGCEPYGLSSCLRVFHNRGLAFRDLAADPTLFPERACSVNGETISWGDVDGDGWLDLFLPTYQGNYLYHNRGPIGAGGAHVFRDVGARANVRLLPGPRPEGTMFGDVDRDGDIDLYSNGVLYQNRSSPGAPLFLPLAAAASGVGNERSLDEGALLADLDLDGDLDLVVAYPFLLLAQVWTNRGDGSFVAGPTLPSPVREGLSAEDWDLDGDLDLTVDAQFFRNDLVETGVLGFTTALSAVPASELSQLTPCWFDWDRDGDLDCVGRWNANPLLLENSTYGANTAPLERRHLRVRVAREALGLEAGVEVEFGATVTVRVTHPGDRFVRTKLVASAAGYLSQSEYVLTFGLPTSVPLTEVRCDVTVDFPNLGKAGRWRVDRDVNPTLGGLRPALLRDREITVFRGGAVRVDGCTLPPTPGRTPGVLTAPLLPTPGIAALPAPVPVPADTWTGLQFTARRTVRLRELILDGKPAPAVPCGGGAGNVTLFALGATPRLLATWHHATNASNQRSAWPCDLVLPPGSYQVHARIDAVRASTLVAQTDDTLLHIDGGMLFTSTTACSLVTAPLAPLAGMAIAVSPDDAVTFVDLGHGLAGGNGIPALRATGTLAFGAPITLSLTAARATAATMLVAGEQAVCWPVFGGTLVPEPTILWSTVTDPRGELNLVFPWRLGRGRPVHLQSWTLDPAAVLGVSASNALRGVH